MPVDPDRLKSCRRPHGLPFRIGKPGDVVPGQDTSLQDPSLLER
jgi:hypothetical protein